MDESIINEDKNLKIANNVTYQVLWESAGKAKVISNAPSDGNALTTVNEGAIQHPSTFSIKREKALELDVDIQASTDLLDDKEGHIVTEIISTECTNIDNKKRRKGRSSVDHHYEAKIMPIKSSKIKKEKFKDDASNMCQKKRFMRSWFHIPEFNRWLEESPIPGFAFCNVCRKDLQPGKSELLKHAATAKHKKRIQAVGTGAKDDVYERRVIDFRSDTCTIPSRDMREYMKDALVGEASFGEDPTVEELESKVANLLGMEAGLFVPSGTMANLIGVLAHCSSRGSLAILGDKSFLYRSTQGSLSEIGNVSQRVVPNLPDGTFDLSELKNILRMHSQNWPSFTLVCIENTHTRSGGKALPIEWVEALGDLCLEYEIPIHLDGSRLINAAVALGASPAKLVKRCSSATFCLSKGLGAPGGSILTGTFDYIERASSLRKSLGGVIHQAGFLAAAGLYGLDNFVSRISKDHTAARALGKAVCNTHSSAIIVNVDSIQTNIVHLVCDNIRVTPEQFCARLEKVAESEMVQLGEGVIVKCLAIDSNIVRLVTHGDLSQEDLRAAIRKLQYVISECDNIYVLEYQVLDN